jgi:hypothetical protein
MSDPSFKSFLLTIKNPQSPSPPPRIFKQREATQALLAGADNFTVKDIEVFEVVARP